MPTYTIVPPEQLNVIGAALAANPKYAASHGVTHCNEFLDAFAVRTFDYHGFAGHMANEIAAFLKGGGDDWKSLWLTGPGGDLAAAFASAQDLANQGYFVVAGLGTSGPHGHCAVVVTGALTHSGTWAAAALPEMLPMIAQAGEETFCGKHLGYGFSPAKCQAGEFGLYVRKP